MKRTLALLAASLSLVGCLSVEGAREGAADRTCRYHDRCGDIGPGRRYTTFAECFNKQVANFQDLWPSDRCRDRINGQTLDVCYRALENTQCDNVIDAVATLSKCQRSDVCSAGTPPNTCNCGQGQTCCNGACVNLSTDRNNCGSCNTICGGGSSCNAGSCR